MAHYPVKSQILMFLIGGSGIVLPGNRSRKDRLGESEWTASRPPSQSLLKQPVSSARITDLRPEVLARRLAVAMLLITITVGHVRNTEHFLFDLEGITLFLFSDGL